MSKFAIVECFCRKGKSVDESINNKKNRRIKDIRTVRSDAEEYKKFCEDMEKHRIDREKELGQWNGNEFVFWIEEVEEEQNGA